MITVQQVGKRYGTFRALNNISFEVGAGEVVGLLGPNGAGKTSLIRILTGYFEPDEGRVLIDGIDVEQHPRAAQTRIGYLPEHTPLYPEMLVQEYLDMTAEFHRVPVDRRSRLLAEAVWATGLEDRLTQPIGELSKGYQQRVGLAQAILHQPKVLILDEPTAGLDPTQVVQVRELILRLAKSATVLFSTHVLPEVEQVCERVLMLAGGELRKDETLANLRAAHRARVALACTAQGGVQGPDGSSLPQADVCRAFEAMDGVEQVKTVNGRAGYVTLELSGDDEDVLCRGAYQLARDRGWLLGELRPVVYDLETVFRELVQVPPAAAVPGSEAHAPAPEATP